MIHEEATASPSETRLLLSDIEAARALGLGKTKLRELLAQGAIRSVRVGRRRLVPVQALKDFVDTLEGQ